jgi:hypothetical protein
MMTDDHNFKNLILDYSVQALEFFAPSEIKRLPPGAVVTPVRQEQTKERLGDRFYELDVALQVDFPDGSREAIVFCIEEDSKGEKAPWRRHAIYCLQLSELLDTTRVVPVILYPFAKKPPSGATQLAGDHGVYLDFRSIIVTLGMMNAKDRVDSANLVERLCLPLMKQDEHEKLSIVTKACEGLAEFEKDWDKRVKYFGFISCYAELRPEQAKEFTETYVEQSRYKEDFMTMKDVFLEMGMAKGMVKGKAEGKEIGSIEGRASLIADFFESGVLTREQARTSLMQLTEPTNPNYHFVASALTRIGADVTR